MYVSLRKRREEMSNTFELGDIVFVNILGDPKVHNAMYIVTKGILKHIPTTTGDSWVVETEDNRLIAYNPNCSNFLTIQKETKPNDY